jgi:hypothetical protein
MVNARSAETARIGPKGHARPWGIWSTEAVDDTIHSVCASDQPINESGWIQISLEERRHKCVPQ